MQRSNSDDTLASALNLFNEQNQASQNAKYVSLTALESSSQNLPVGSTSERSLEWTEVQRTYLLH